MGAWITGIVCTVCLGVLLEIILPDGQTAKYVKGVYSLLIVFVIISPLQKIVEGGIEFDFDTDAYSASEEGVDNFGGWREEIKNAEISAYLVENEINGDAKTEMSANNCTNIAGIEIFVSETEFDEGEKNNIEQRIKSLIARRYGVDEKNVRVVWRSDNGN